MISDFFINRPIVAMVIAIVTVIVGLIAMRGLPLAQFPEIVPPQIVVSTTYTGADARHHRAVGRHADRAADERRGQHALHAVDQRQRRHEQLFVTFDVETDVNIDQVNVQNRFAQAQPNLPVGCHSVRDHDPQVHGLPMLVISLYSPNNSYDSLFLANYANININDALYRVPGVGEVTDVRRQRLRDAHLGQAGRARKLGLTVPDLASAVRQQSAVNPSGQVGAEPAPAGHGKDLHRPRAGAASNAGEFGQIVVRSNPDGSVVRLKDVARIELGALNYQQITRFNGQPAPSSRSSRRPARTRWRSPTASKRRWRS